MSAPPYMKLYIADYHGDTTSLVSAQEHGAYLLLLMAMWRAGGSLPLSDDNLARIARCSPAEWEQLKGIILPFFKISRGKLTHKRISREMAKYESTSGKRSDAGKRGVEEKARKNNNKAEAIAENAESNCSHNQNHNQKEERTPVVPQGGQPAKPSLKSEVDAIWELAPAGSRRRSSKADVERTLSAAVRRGHSAEAVTGGLRAYFASPDATKDGGQFAKGVHRMIEGDRWQGFAPAQPAPAATPSDPWRYPLMEWRKNRYWNTLDWGPRPNQEGCGVPADRLTDEDLQRQKPGELVLFPTDRRQA